MPKQDGFAKVPNSIIRKWMSEPEKIGAYAVVDYLLHSENPAAKSPRGLGQLIGWAPSKTWRFLKDIKHLPVWNTFGTLLERAETTESRACELARNGIGTEAERIGKLHLICIFTDTDLREAIFQSWNFKNVVTHKSITDFTEALKKALKLHTVDQIMEAMQNYGCIVNSQEFWFDYKWRLDVFLLGKKGNNLRNFLSESYPHDNYRKESITQKPKGSEGLKSFDEQGAKGGAF